MVVSTISITIPNITDAFAQDDINQSSTLTNQTNSTVEQSQSMQFIANLSSQTVVPIVDETNARGEAGFNVNPQIDTIDYIIATYDIDQVLSATMHLGTPGVNGPVIVYLYRADSPTGHIDGLLAKETITANELDGPLNGKTIKDLVAAMSNENIYVTVNTAPYPNGEIRGQIEKIN
ncbi:MAG: CHRD domain-containing protein [Candidatus Nitrosocosmicus sp.]|nr:CHRD domain-containing protein [Candidatus Nitrosocosmicus sp.]